jgi:hypothetical protein
MSRVLQTLPLEKLRKQLAAPQWRKRVAALVEIEALGAAGRAVARDVAALLEDEVPQVSWQAMHTFREIGGGATDAVPSLLALLAKKESPLATRAGACLGVVGPTATAAVPALRAAFEADPKDGAFIGSMLAIAPMDPAVVDAVVSAAFSDDYGVSSVVTPALAAAGDPTLDRVFEQMIARLAGDEDSRRGVAALLMQLGARRPEQTAGLLRALLRDPSPAVLRPAAAAVGALPAPRPGDLVEAVVAVAGREGEAQEQAVKVLSGLGPDAEPGQRTLLDLLFQHADMSPLPGPEGARGRIFALAALGISRGGAAKRAADPMPLLLQWLLKRAAEMEGKKRAPSPSLYTVADVIDAAATLAPRSSALREAILELVAASRRSLRDAMRGLDAGPIDFDRRLRRVLSTFEDGEALLSRAVALGLPRLDPWT